jgi:hypothetical protein
MACNLALHGFKRLDMRLEFRPTGKPIQTRDLKLRRGERRSSARSLQGFGLVFQMTQISPLEKRTRLRM